MVAAGLAENQRLLALALSEASRRLRRSLRLAPLAGRHLAAGAPQAILGPREPLREGDLAAALDIYAGAFRFENRLIETGGLSPFALPMPSPRFAAALHGFGWLRHLEAAGDALAGANARALVSDWIADAGHAASPVAQAPGVAARRAIGWIGAANFLLCDAPPAFAKRFGRSLAGQLRTLRQGAPDAPDGLPRLRTRIALAYGALALDMGGTAIRLAARNLGEELDRQVFADGVHLSRDPAAIVDVLADLLPLAKLFDAENHAAPKGLVTALDRMLPMLRFFRHGDGALASFNGAGAADPRLVTRLMRHDETLGEPLSFARQGGYGRLSAGGTVLVADIGAPPAPALAGEAHAGTLSFEFSGRGQRFVVNCGVSGDERLRQMARATAAHSTLTLADASSARFETPGPMRRFLGSPLVAGPAVVPATIEGEAGGTRIVASHDGYEARFGIRHERTLFLARDGASIEGVDRLSGSPKGFGRVRPTAAIRFHLHPDVAATREGEDIALLGATGECWLFRADRTAQIEDSLFLADAAGPRRSHQIVVEFDLAHARAVAWSFRRRRGACPTADALSRHAGGR
ncbi:heparinase II/III family protein [Aureimonas leprariae]|uniref:Heparinase n=1 Tax=Plantimonas leprariae TaxID=2615207 RepID=A0A7V7PNK6_9HYPH|nr:heparinase II/III family protein [Aureimonas leprariae]KAB0679374.1 heparinase [Aureimonas leprariae]